MEFLGAKVGEVDLKGERATVSVEVDETGEPSVAVDEPDSTTLRVAVAFQDDMELPRGWTSGGDGQWEWAHPQGLGGGVGGMPDPDGDHSSGSGLAWGVDLTIEMLTDTLTV